MKVFSEEEKTAIILMEFVETLAVKPTTYDTERRLKDACFRWEMFINDVSLFFLSMLKLVLCI